VNGGAFSVPQNARGLSNRNAGREIDRCLKREAAEREAKKHETIRKEQEERALYQQLKAKYGEEQEHAR
jgi:hypothetical protein